MGDQARVASRNSKTQVSYSQQMSEKLKILRVQSKLTLEELATAADLTRSYVSKVERGIATPSIGAALKLAHVLNVPVEHLFGSEPDTDTVTIVRAAARDAPGAPMGARGSRLVASTSPGHRMLAFVLRPAEAKARDHPMSHHEGEELLYVLAGRVGLQLARRKEVLEAGDCAHFNSTVPHKITSLSGDDAQVLIVISPDARQSPKSG